MRVESKYEPQNECQHSEASDFDEPLRFPAGVAQENGVAFGGNLAIDPNKIEVRIEGYPVGF